MITLHIALGVSITSLETIVRKDLEPQCGCKLDTAPVEIHKLHCILRLCGAKQSSVLFTIFSTARKLPSDAVPFFQPVFYDLLVPSVGGRVVGLAF